MKRLALVAANRKEACALTIGDWVCFRNKTWEPVVSVTSSAGIQMYVWVQGYSVPFMVDRHEKIDVAREEMD